MIEHRPILDTVSHLGLMLSVIIIAFPLYVTFVASTQTAQTAAQAPLSLMHESYFINNYGALLT